MEMLEILFVWDMGATRMAPKSPLRPGRKPTAKSRLTWKIMTKSQTSEPGNRQRIEADLERRILQGLALEWQESLDLLDPPERARMKPPFFDLADMESRHGQWSARRRQITLGRRLVMNHSWDSVREVLRHEMAHQFVDEVLRVVGEPPHGPAFHRACERLRADPRASGDLPPLDERLEKGEAEEADRILLRVRKLFALADSANPHEAESAMRKAHQLIARHNLERIREARPRDFVSAFVGKPALRRFREEYALDHLLQDFYGVQGIYVPAFVLEKGRMGRALEISGTSANVRTAAYVHDFVRGHIDRRWAEYNRGRGLTRHRKTDFGVGLIQGFREKMAAETAESDKDEPDLPDERSLVRIPDPQLDRYMRKRYPRITRFRRGGREDPGVRAAGEEEGRKMVIARGIETTGEGGKFLPER